MKNLILIVVAAVLLIAVVVLAILLGVGLSKRRKARLAAARKEGERSEAPDGMAEELATEHIVRQTQEVEDSAETLHVEMDPYTPEEEKREVRTVIATPLPERTRKPKSAPAEEEEEITFTEMEQREEAERIERSLTRPGTVRIYRDEGGLYRFRVCAANHEAIAHSSSYASKISCKRAVSKVLNELETVEIADTLKNPDYKPVIGKRAFEVYRDNDGRYRFRLRAANTNVTLCSHGYSSKTNAKNAIASVIHVSRLHTMVDEETDK